MDVIKRSGEIQAFSIEKIKITLQFVSKDYEDIIDFDKILNFAEKSLYSGISSKEITKVLILTTRALIEEDPAYSHITKRLTLNSLYKEIFGPNINFQNLDALYRKSFVKNLKEAVSQGYLSKKLLTYDLEKLASHIIPERDERFKYLGIHTLIDQYLLKNPINSKIYETPQAFWMRIAMGLCLNENSIYREKHVIDFYEIMSSLTFLPTTPTLLNSGKPRPQMCSCFLNTCGDDLDHIYETIKETAHVSKYSGGTGSDWTNIRSTGSLINSTGSKASGVIPFLKILNDSTSALSLGGRRRGAVAAYLETWHLDIESFLELRKNTGDERRRTHDLNTANWIPDLFIKRVINNEIWTLFSPNEVPDLHNTYGKEFERLYRYYEEKAHQGKIKNFKKIAAVDLWRKMINMLYETGHPWITFKDPCNLRSPQDHTGVIHNSNLCTEITLNNSADETSVCNLGSINLSKCIKDGGFDMDTISKITPTAVRLLDNVIDLNFYPTTKSERSNIKHRPIGLGIMGFQDALYMLNVEFESDKAVSLADKLQEMISFYTILASSQLAKEKTPYSTFRGSKWDRGLLPLDTLSILEKERGVKVPIDRIERLNWSVVRKSIKKHGMRNSNTMAIAPTATIANIAGVTPSIEPIYKNIYVKSNQGGNFTIINEFLIDELKSLGIWDKKNAGSDQAK